MFHKTIELWDKETYQGEGKDGFRTTMDTYIIDGSKKRAAVLICPGGGYSFTSEREAEPIALKFNAAGFHAFVLYYSVFPRLHPQPLIDLSRSICIIRDNAEVWNVYTEKIAVCGFSAGGHLAASLGVHWDKPYLKNLPGIKIEKNFPNALILCYPVITSGEFAHRGSFENLLGNNASEGLLYEMSLENQVSKSTPPAFIWHTFEDSIVPLENSLLFAKKMREVGIPFELHVYPKGPHGLSLATAETENDSIGSDSHVATWFNLCVEWLKELFNLK